MDGDTIAGFVAMAVGVLMIRIRGAVAYFSAWQNQKLFGVEVSQKPFRLLATVVGLGFVLFGVAFIFGWGKPN